MKCSPDGKINGNPIGWLQELCMARRWPPPFYETQAEIGLPHERQFTIACHVSTYCETGRGKSKKEAKRLAANQMWQYLQDLPLDSQEDGTDDVSNKCHQQSLEDKLTNLMERRIFFVSGTLNFPLICGHYYFSAIPS